jgi:hypothetical protein
MCFSGKVGTGFHVINGIWRKRKMLTALDKIAISKAVPKDQLLLCPQCGKTWLGYRSGEFQNNPQVDRLNYNIDQVILAETWEELDAIRYWLHRGCRRTCGASDCWDKETSAHSETYIAYQDRVAKMRAKLAEDREDPKKKQVRR